MHMRHLGFLVVLSESNMEMCIYSISPGLELSWRRVLVLSETKSPEN